MATLASPETFENWNDLSRWQPARFPDGEGGTWTWAEPGATVGTRDGWLELSVDRFTRSHDRVQIFDNPKHLLACTEAIPVPDEGLVVEVEMAGALLEADPSDWRNGFVSFNLMDFENGLILDGILNGARSGAIFERLHIPGVTARETAFTTIADGAASKPGTVHRFRFEYDPNTDSARVLMDGAVVLEALRIPARIRSFTPGFGLITLWPITDGTSTSIRGQGAGGRLGTICVGTLR